MILVTKRLILRPWTIDDAEECYKYCKDPKVGPVAGWAPHTSVEQSKVIIEKLLSKPDTFAIVLKETMLPIGNIAIKTGSATDLTSGIDECEIGYWLGVPYWGQGIMPEALERIIRYAFEDLGMINILCGYYDGNDKSKRVQEKAGFKHLWTTERVEVAQLNEVRKGHVNILSKEKWIQRQERLKASDPIYMRRSYRGRFMDYKVPRNDLIRIVNAGLAAPSGCNKQTTSFVIVDDDETLEKLKAVITPKVAETVRSAICVLTKRVNAYRDKCFAVQDYSAAIENMLLRISELGYQSCWYEGHITDDDRICDRMEEILGVPDDMDLVCFLPVGIGLDKHTPLNKKPFDERVWFNSFGK